MIAASVQLELLALALAVDAAAVTLALAAAGTPLRGLVKAWVLFAVFQAGMAGLGAVAGAWLASWAAAWDHWVAFALLVVVGGRMILGTADPDTEPEPSWGGLLVLAVATSLDALAAGVGLPMLDLPLGVSIAGVGLTTALACVVAGLLGQRVSGVFGQWAERIGGAVLIAIGARIVASHMGWLPAGW